MTGTTDTAVILGTSIECPNDFRKIKKRTLRDSIVKSIFIGVPREICRRRSHFSQFRHLSKLTREGRKGYSKIKVHVTGPHKTDFENEKYIKFCTYFVQFGTPSPKFCTPLPLARSAIQIWGLVTWNPLPQCNFNIKNWIIILYSFCTPSPKFCTPFPLALSTIQIWGAGDMQPPKCNLNRKNGIRILYNFVHRVQNFVHHSLLRYR